MFRSPNFSAKEIETLVYHLELNPDLLKPAVRLNRDGNKSGPRGLSVKDKLKIWAKIAEEINLTGEGSIIGVTRTAVDVKNKWSDLKSRVKNKAEDIRRKKKFDKSFLSPIDERILQLISQAYASIHEGVHSSLPPVNLHYIDRRRHKSTSSEEISEETNEESNECLDILNKTNDNLNCKSILSNSLHSDDILGSSEINGKNKIKIEETESVTSSPNIIQLPFINVSEEGFSNLVKKRKHSTNKLSSGMKNKKQKTNEQNNDTDVTNSIDMLWESQQDLKNELKNIKEILLKISQQNRKRLQQENEKIQLKKIKILLKCKEQGLDYEELVNEFL